MIDRFPLGVALARLLHHWANRFRRSLQGSPGRTGDGKPEQAPKISIPVPRVPAERTPAPDVLAFCGGLAG